jgi:hypothetical protein
MQIPLCRLVAMAIVRSTLSSNLALLEDNFVHGYQKGAAMFYLSTTNGGGLVDKVMDDDLESWGPLWCAVNDCFEEYLSSIPTLRHLKGVKFSVCDGFTKGKHGGLSSLAYIQPILLSTLWLILLF